MQITVRTEAEAERIVADVWLVLERRGLPSPKLTVKPQPQSPGLTIEFQFEQQAHEALVREELLSPIRAFTLIETARPVRRKRPPMPKQVAMVVNEKETRRAAKALIDMHGSRAARVAVQRAENAGIGGSEVAALNWQQIAQVIERMQLSPPILDPLPKRPALRQGFFFSAK
jgi:hypothetical protein